MATSPILALPQLIENQSQAFTTANEAMTILEQAMNRRLAKASGNTDVTLTLDELLRNVLFDISGNTGAIDLTFPSRTENPSTVSSPLTQRLCMVKNTGSGTITAKTDVSGATISLIGGEVAMVFINGVDVLKLLSSTGGLAGTGTFTIGAFVAGVMPPVTEIMRYTITEATTFPDNFSGSRGTIGVNPTATVTLSVYRNVTLIGTIDISTAGVFTFTTSGSVSEDFSAGDYLSVVTSAADATAANISFTLKGTR